MKLEQLLAEAYSQPQDATNQAAMLAELYNQRFSHFASPLLLLHDKIGKFFILWMMRIDIVHEEKGNFWSTFLKYCKKFHTM
jgi:hypothetical protein